MKTSADQTLPPSPDARSMRVCGIVCRAVGATAPPRRPSLMMRRRSWAGYTLIELVAVLSVMGALGLLLGSMLHRLMDAYGSTAASVTWSRATNDLSVEWRADVHAADVVELADAGKKLTLTCTAERVTIVYQAREAVLERTVQRSIGAASTDSEAAVAAVPVPLGMEPIVLREAFRHPRGVAQFSITKETDGRTAVTLDWPRPQPQLLLATSEGIPVAQPLPLKAILDRDRLARPDRAPTRPAPSAPAEPTP